MASVIRIDMVVFKKLAIFSMPVSPSHFAGNNSQVAQLLEGHIDEGKQ